MKTTGENVILYHIHESIVSKGGLDLSSELVREQKYYRGTILCVGDKTENLKEGDIVWYDITRGSRVMYKGDDITIINYQNIAIIE
jgi:co-chaperonin GroES (HSP10)